MGIIQNDKYSEWHFYCIIFSDEEIPLPDVEPASFLALLKFLYSDEVQIDPETVMTTLYTAKKYAVPALEKHCVDFLKRHLCADNAFMLLTQARLFDEPQLAALCLETIDKNTPEALAAEGKCLFVCFIWGLSTCIVIHQWL